MTAGSPRGGCAAGEVDPPGRGSTQRRPAPRPAHEQASLLLTVAAATAVVLLGACASEQTAAERWAREVRILETWQLEERPYDEIGVLLETEAIRSGGEEAAVDVAKNRLRLRAAGLDGDAVVIGFCERGVVPDDPATRLRPTVVCEGLVIRWLAPRP